MIYPYNLFWPGKKLKKCMDKIFIKEKEKEKKKKIII